MPLTAPDNLFKPDSTTQITPLETTLAAMQDSVQTALNTRAVKSYKPADLAALAAITTMTSGDLAVVLEGGAIFEYGTSWVQRTEARFGSASARDTAYAKASGVYRVQGAKVLRTDLGYVEQYVGLYNATSNPIGASTAGWFPEGAYGIVALTRTSDQGMNNGLNAETGVAFNNSAWGTGAPYWTSSTPDRITFNRPGLYDFNFSARSSQAGVYFNAYVFDGTSGAATTADSEFGASNYIRLGSAFRVAKPGDYLIVRGRPTPAVDWNILGGFIRLTITRLGDA